ncbi:MAG TPA: hypothetical protein VMY69_06005 [Phycisphaerae bacterium]|nr:hypothetical protein [Phycisphaerae bacterium]
MGKLIVLNISAQRAVCGGKVIFPNQSAQVDESARSQALANPHLMIAGEEETSRAAQTPDGKPVAVDNALAEILKHNVQDVVRLAEGLDAEQVEKLIALEEKAENKKLFGLVGGPRKSLISELQALLELKKETSEEENSEEE